MTSKFPSVGGRVTLLDLGIVVAGAVAFGFSFVGYYTASVSGVTRSTGAWHGFFGWFGAVLALLGAAVLVLALALLEGRGPAYRGVLAVFAIAAACEIAALFTSGFDTAHAHWARVEADTGHGYGYWISLVSVIVGAGLALAGAAQVRDRPDAFGRSARLGGPRGEG